MKKYIQEGSNDKPIVILDSEQGSIFIGGSSIPENVFDVFNPILEWIDSYTESPNPSTKIDFFFEYVNTASSHMIMRIFDKIKTLNTSCQKLQVNWHYLKGDHDMRDFGKELADMVDYQVKIIDSDQFQLNHYF